jgi:hypothetical protein
MLPMWEVRIYVPGFRLYGFFPERDHANDKTWTEGRSIHGKFHVVLPYLFRL